MDRRRDAQRLLVSHPQWSDRAIARLCNLSSKTVAALRERSGETAPSAGPRVGLDGRRRPLDASAGRRRAAELLEQRPDASLREVSASAGVSVGTVRDVRKRLSEGRSPIAEPRAQREPTDHEEPAAVTAPGLEPIAADSALRSSESGRMLAEWLTAHAVTRADWQDFVDGVPVSRAYVIADLARAVASCWLELATEMERRARGG